MNNLLIKDQNTIRQELLKEFSTFSEFLLVKKDLSSLLDHFSLHYHNFRNNLFNLIEEKLSFSVQSLSPKKEKILINKILNISIEKNTASTYTSGEKIALNMNILFPFLIGGDSITGGLYFDKQKSKFQDPLFIKDHLNISSYIKHRDFSELEAHIDNYIKRDIENIFNIYEKELNRLDNHIEKYGKILNVLYQSNYNIKDIFNNNVCYSLDEINKELEILKDVLPLTHDLTIEKEFEELSKIINYKKEKKLNSKKLI